jgi:hypothetical protein
MNMLKHMNLEKWSSEPVFEELASFDVCERIFMRENSRDWKDCEYHSIMQRMCLFKKSKN